MNEREVIEDRKDRPSPPDGSEARVIEIDHYSEEAPLTYLFGDSARVKIIAAFVAERGNDISVSDISRLAGVARSTVYNHLSALEDLGLIKHTRDIENGHSSLYELNESEEVANLCRKLDATVLDTLTASDKFE